MVWQCMICSGGVVKYGEGSGGQGLLICYGGGHHLYTGNGGHHLGTAQGGGGTHNSTKRCSRALGSLSKSAALQRWKAETVLWCNTVEWWRGVGGEGNPRWFLQGATIYEPAGGAVWRGWPPPSSSSSSSYRHHHHHHLQTSSWCFLERVTIEAGGGG